MKWIFALNEKSVDSPSGDNYELMATVAVESARANAPSLEPHLIWNGRETEFTELMRSRGVTVIIHRLSFEDAINEAARDAQWKHTAKGAMLRLDIPMLFPQLTGQILYTDVDVMFLDDPSRYLFNSSIFACSSEFQFDDFQNINSGVMILNLEAAKQLFPDFIHWTKANLNWIPDYDQGAFRTYFAQRWDRLDQRMNWKPYWNVGKNPIIVHFHGPKPTDFDLIKLRPRFDSSIGNIYGKLFNVGRKGYDYYLRKWLGFANDAFKEKINTPTNSQTQSKLVIIDIPLNTITQFNIRNQFKSSTQEWIFYRLEIFFRYTLQSLKAQTDPHFTCVVHYLPESESHIVKFLETKEPLPPNVTFRSDGDVFIERISKNYNWIFKLRLDSDNMIQNSFIEQLKKVDIRPDLQCIIGKSGYMLDSHTGRLAYWNHNSSAFNTYVFDTDKYEADKCLPSTAPDNHMNAIQLNHDFLFSNSNCGRSYMFVVHSENLQNNFDELLESEYCSGLVTNTEERSGALRMFGIQSDFV
jgi:hypothetical protein